MTWYSGSPVERPLDKLLASGVTHITQLFNDPDFFSELKSFNPKLLDFLTNNPQILQQSLTYISTPPSPTDTDERKYKYPMMTIEMIETETISILNAFFKKSPNQNTFVIEELFKLVEEKEILPILGGYFIRVICILVKLRYKEIMDFIYSQPEILKHMVAHTDNISITQSLQMFLCLESNKTEQLIQGKQQIKIDTLKLVTRELVTSGGDQGKIVNICYLLISLVDNYYLVADGKRMLEVVLGEEVGEWLLGRLVAGDAVGKETVGLLVLAVLRYYSYSSYNVEQKEVEGNRQVMERLEKEPFILSVCRYYKQLLDKVLETTSILQKSNLIEILCQLIQFNSDKLYHLVTSTQFFKHLLNILFLNPCANILHHQINKTIEVVFSNERAIYQKYQEHLFCDIDIINITISRIESETMKTIVVDKDYFGYLIKIIKNYSKIQTSNNRIYEVIERNKDLWGRVANGIIKAYTEVTQKELGTYEIPEPKPVEYTETRTMTSSSHPAVMVNLNIDDEGKTFRNMTTSYPHGRLSFEATASPPTNFFELPIEVPPIEQKSPNPNVVSVQQKQEMGEGKVDIEEKLKKIPLIIEIPEGDQPLVKPTKSPSWEEYKKNASILAQEKLDIQKRSISQEKERRLTPNARGKSPGVAKVKRSWGDSGSTPNDEKPAENKSKVEDKAAVTQSKIPNPPKNPISHSMMLTKEQTKELPKKNEMMSQSMGNLNDLKHITVRFVPSNKQEEPKKTRQVQPKDMALLNFLGIKVSSK